MVSGGEIPGARIYEPYRRPDPDALLPDDQQICFHCGKAFDEEDMYPLGGDNRWTCELCIVGRSDQWRKARVLMAEAAAILRLRMTQEADRVANELTLIVEGM